jgi:hypothetical protein
MALTFAPLLLPVVSAFISYIISVLGNRIGLLCILPPIFSHSLCQERSDQIHKAIGNMAVLLSATILCKI